MNPPSTSHQLPLIAVGGPTGAGKTTLARALARELDWVFIGESAEQNPYMRDLFEDPNRWSLEAQLRFILDKAKRILATLNAPGIVLDRSLAEDAHVFARYFFLKGHMARRTYSTYMKAYNIIAAVVPSPKVLVFVHCPLKIAKARIKQRGRQIDEYYPPRFLEDIHSIYRKFVPQQSGQVMIHVDTAKVDVREDVGFAKRLAERVLAEVE